MVKNVKPDSTLSRTIRPSILIWLTLLFSALMVIDGNFFGIVIKEVYVGVLESIMMVVYGAYFVAKSVEHVTRITQDNKDDTSN